MPDKVLRRVAGGVVVGKTGKIVIVNQNNDSWSLPKGGIEEGETAESAAMREIAEESGIAELTFVQKLGEYERAKIGKHGTGEDATEIKQITMFLYSTDQTTLVPTDPINPEAKWVDIDEVTSYLTHRKDQAFFNSVRLTIEDFLRRKA